MEVDVVIIGGAYAGASTGLLLKRKNPAWRVLIIEKAEHFDRKVGESTTEVSSRFMTTVLGIGRHLGHHQLNKQGCACGSTPMGSFPLSVAPKSAAAITPGLVAFRLTGPCLTSTSLSLPFKPDANSGDLQKS